MFVARVTGSLVATQKVASMTGHKLLTVEPYRVDEKGRDRLVPTGRTFVVVDTLGAGIDEMVLICQGSSAAWAASRVLFLGRVVTTRKLIDVVHAFIVLLDLG